MTQLHVAFSRTRRLLVALMTEGDTHCAETLTPVADLKTEFPDIEFAPADTAKRAIEDTYLAGPVEVSAEAYHEALGAVPPLARRGSDFICGELHYGTVAIFYTVRNGRYFKLLQRFRTSFMEIHQMVDAFIAGNSDVVLAAERRNHG